MRRPLGFEDIEGPHATARRPEQHIAAAQRLRGWAREIHPDDEVDPAQMLVAAAWHLQQIGDHEQAVEVATLAVEASGDAPPDTRCWLHEALISAGLLDRARTLGAEIRRSRPTEPGVYLVVGESYEMIGELEEANRWFTTGRVRLGSTEPGSVPSTEIMMLMAARRRVRTELGFPPDEDDLAASEHQQRFTAGLDALGEG